MQTFVFGLNFFVVRAVEIMTRHDPTKLNQTIIIIQGKTKQELMVVKRYRILCHLTMLLGCHHHHHQKKKYIKYVDSHGPLYHPSHYSLNSDSFCPFSSLFAVFLPILPQQLHGKVKNNQLHHHQFCSILFVRQNIDLEQNKNVCSCP